MLACQRPPKKRREPIDYPEGPDGRQVINLKSAEGRRIYRSRALEMHQRQGGYDAITGEWMNYRDVTFDHEAGRGAGKRDDRIVVDGKWKNAAVLEANNFLKGSKRYAWFEGKYLPVLRPTYGEIVVEAER